MSADIPTRPPTFLINAVDNELASPVATPDTTIEVTSATDLPVVPFYLVIDPFDDGNGKEYLYCSAVGGVGGTTLTVERNLEGSVATVHSAGEIVRFAYTKQELDDLWDNITVREPWPTGLLTGGEITVPAPATGTLVTVAAGEGVIVDSYTDHKLPVYQKVTWAEQTWDGGPITTRSRTYLYIDSTGTLQIETLPRVPTSSLRDRIYVGWVTHDEAGAGLLLGQVRLHVLPAEMSFLLADYISFQGDAGSLQEGTGVFSPNADLSFDISEQRWFAPGINSDSAPQDPNFRTVPAASPASHYYILSDGSIFSGPNTLIDPTQYESAPGVVSGVGGGPDDSTIQRVYVTLAGNTVVMYGQEKYANLNQALTRLNGDIANHVTPAVLGTGTLIAYILIERSETDLQNGTGVIILDPGGIPIGGGAVPVHEHDALYLRLDGANSPMTGSVDWGSNKITNLAPGAATGEAVEFDQLPHALVSTRHTDVTVDPVLIRQVLQASADAGNFVLDYRMNWRNEWAPGTYEKHDVVRDGSWTMAANKQTTDRAGIQPEGNPTWLTGLGDTPAWTPQSDVTPQVIVGYRISSSSAHYFVSRGRIWTRTGQTYRTFTVRDPLGPAPIWDIGQEFTATEDGWLVINIDDTLIAEGSTWDIGVFIGPATPSTSQFSGTWAYKRDNGNPGAGEIFHQDDQGEMRVHQEDDTSNRDAELATVSPGDTIAAGGITWTVTSAAKTTGTVYTFDVVPESRAQEGDLTVVFTVTDDATIDYDQITGGWVSYADIQGFRSTDGYDNIVLSQDQFGVDEEVDLAVVSDDWDIVAYSGSAGGGGDGSGPAPNGLPAGGTDLQYLRKDGTTDFVSSWQDPIWLELAGGTMSGAIDMGLNLITNVQNPGSPQDAATKAYVDSQSHLVSPLTTKGQLWGYSTTDAAVPAPGADDLYLTSDAAEATGVKWSPAPGGSVPSGSGVGELLFWDNVNLVWSPAKTAINANAAPYNATPGVDADQSAALQAAIDAADNDAISIVWVSPGSYRLDTGLLVPRNVWIMNSGGWGGAWGVSGNTPATPQGWNQGSVNFLTNQAIHIVTFEHNGGVANDWRGGGIVGINFADYSASHQTALSAIRIRNLQHVRVVDCHVSWLLNQSGRAFYLDPASAAAGQYAKFWGCTTTRVHKAAEWTGNQPDDEFWHCFFYGAASSQDPTPGSIGYHIRGNSNRIYGGSVQFFDIFIYIDNTAGDSTRGKQNKVIGTALESHSGLTPGSTTHGILIEGVTGGSGENNWCVENTFIGVDFANVDIMTNPITLNEFTARNIFQNCVQPGSGRLLTNDSGYNNYFDGAPRFFMRTSATTITASNSENVINMTGGGTTLNLMAAAKRVGRVLWVMNSAGGDVTVDPEGTETIGGSATYTLNPGDLIAIISNGSNWLLLETGTGGGGGTPLTTLGDLLTHDGVNEVRLPKTDERLLTFDPVAGSLVWSSILTLDLANDTATWDVDKLTVGDGVKNPVIEVLATGAGGGLTIINSSATGGPIQAYYDISNTPNLRVRSEVQTAGASLETVLQLGSSQSWLRYVGQFNFRGATGTTSYFQVVNDGPFIPVAVADASGSVKVRNIHFSSVAPGAGDGEDGDVWIRYQ